MGKRLLELREVFSQPIQSTKTLFDSDLLVPRQGLVRKPGTPLLAEQIGRRATLDEVGSQYRVNLVLEPGALANDLLAPGDLAP